MKNKIFAVLTALFLLSVTIIPTGFAIDGAEFVTVFEEDFTANDATTEGIELSDMQIGANANITGAGTALTSVVNYGGAIVFPQDLGENFKVSGKYFFDWNDIRFMFNLDEPVYSESNGTFSFANGYMFREHKYSSHIQLVAGDGTTDGVPTGWTDKTYEAGFDYKPVEFQLSYERGVVNYTSVCKGQTREVTFDLTQGGTVPLSKKNGYFAIWGKGANALSILNLKIEKVKSPEITGKSTTLSAMGVYSNSENSKMDVWVNVNRTADTVETAKLYVDGEYAADMTYANNRLEGELSLSGKAKGSHSVYAEIVDIYGGKIKTEETSLYIADYKAVMEGFSVNGTEISNISDAAGKTVTAEFETDTEVMAMISIIKDGLLADIACKKVSAEDGAVSFAVPNDADRVVATLFKDFANPSPLCGAGELR